MSLIFEIAEMMKLSRRTIEYYTSNMKKKFSCESKRELIDTFKESGLLAQLKEAVDIKYLLKRRTN